jgi:hypothetical protein
MSSKPLIFRLPKSNIAPKPKKTIDDIWPSIVNHVFSFPKTTDGELYKKYGHLCKNDGRANFSEMLFHRKITDIRKAAKKKLNAQLTDKPAKRSDSLELNETMIAAFEKKRKRQGIIHLSAMDAIVQNAHVAIKKESEKVLEGEASLGLHLSNASTLHKLGSSVYGLDNMSQENQAKIQLAIITNFNPSDNKEEAVDI